MRVGGVARVPGDKSITHRALMLAAMAPGRSRLTGALTSFDARSTARVLRALGAGVSPLREEGVVTVTGRPAFRSPARPLDCGNSGTTARLLLGVLAGQRVSARLTGDQSLRRRPMGRVADPLRAMGADIEPAGADRLPLTVRGGRLHAVCWDLPVASAQLKSALLLAGVTGRVPVDIGQAAGRSRDHTERLLRRFGYRVAEAGDRIRFEPSGRLEPFDLAVPGDPSSAAFLAGAAVLAESGELRIADVCLNPTRLGFVDVIRRMGGRISVDPRGDRGGEPVGDLIVEAGALRAADLLPGEVPSLVDEVPLLAILAARAVGESHFPGLGELRVKESDRLASLAANLRAVGVEATVEGDDLRVLGSSRPPAGRVTTGGDHRIAMAFLVLGTAPGARIGVDDPGCAAVSFPGFPAALAGLRSRP